MISCIIYKLWPCLFSNILDQIYIEKKLFNLGMYTSVKHYSVMQSGRDSFCGDVVLESVKTAFRDEHMRNKCVRIFIMMILTVIIMYEN